MFREALRQNVSIGKLSFNVYKKYPIEKPKYPIEKPKYPIEKPKYPNKYLSETFNTQVTFAIPKMNEKGVGNVPICSKN